MKKLMALILSLLLLFSLAACGGDMVVNNSQNQRGDDNQSGNNIPGNKGAAALVFEAIPSPVTAPIPPEFTCAECGAYCNAYDHDSLCGICHLPAGISADIWSLGTSGIEREIREMICRGTDMHHGGSAIMALPGGFDELLELYALHLTQDEEAIVERLKKIACTSRDCACPYRTKAALDSIFTDFLDMNEIRFPAISGGKPRQLTILHEGHNNKINISYGIINGMDFTVAVHPMYSTNEDRIKNWLDSLSPVRTLGDIEIYLSQEPSEPEEEFSYRGVTHAYFDLDVYGQYVAIYVSNPPCVMPPQEEMKGPWWDYTCDYCNNLSQGPRCFGAPVDVQAALDVIVQFEFKTLPFYLEAYSENAAGPGENHNEKQVDLACCIKDILVRDTAITGDNSVTVTANDFIMTLSSDKNSYNSTDVIKIWGTLEYIGDNDSITIWSGCPFMHFSISGGFDEYDFDSALGAFQADVLVSNTLEKGSVYHFDYKKSGGWDGDSPEAAFWTNFFSEEDLVLPKGTYIITLTGAFGLTENTVISEIGLKTELSFVVA